MQFCTIALVGSVGMCFESYCTCFPEDSRILMRKDNTHTHLKINKIIKKMTKSISQNQTHTQKKCCLAVIKQL